MDEVGGRATRSATLAASSTTTRCGPSWSAGGHHHAGLTRRGTASSHRLPLDAPGDEAIKVARVESPRSGHQGPRGSRQYAQFGIEESTGDPKIDELVLNLPGENLDANGQPLDGGRVRGPAARQRAGPPAARKNTHAFSAAASRARAGSPQGKALGSSSQTLEARLARASCKAGGQGRLRRAGQPPSRRAAPRATPSRRAQLTSTTLTRLIAQPTADAASELERALLDHVEGKALKTSDLVSAHPQRGVDDLQAAHHEGSSRAAPRRRPPGA
jgi:hypothetical protein